MFMIQSVQQRLGILQFQFPHHFCQNLALYIHPIISSHTESGENFKWGCFLELWDIKKKKLWDIAHGCVIITLFDMIQKTRFEKQLLAKVWEQVDSKKIFYNVVFIKYLEVISTFKLFLHYKYCAQYFERQTTKL